MAALNFLPLKTKRLLLRDFVIDDWQSVHSYAADPDVVRYVTWGPNTEADSKAFVNRVIQQSKVSPRVDFELAVVSTADDTLAGAASIHISDPINKEGWVGYCFNKKFWGQGMATEANQALLSFGFQHLGLHRIFATVDPDNIASATVLKRIGMIYEGRLRGHKLIHGQRRDTDLFAIVESDVT